MLPYNKVLSGDSSKDGVRFVRLSLEDRKVYLRSHFAMESLHIRARNELEATNRAEIRIANKRPC